MANFYEKSLPFFRLTCSHVLRLIMKIKSNYLAYKTEFM